MVLAAFYSSISVAVVAVAVLSWVLFWGTLSAAVLAIWRAPNLHSLWLGLAGPFGPLIALGFGVAQPKPADAGEDEQASPPPIDQPPSSGPRSVP